MKLINVRTLKLEEFYDSHIPLYAILSHCWEDDEATYQEWKSGQVNKHRKGHKKILDACSQTKKDGIDYVWIDTCCIDKSSSAELSEAVNSMFKWYKGALRCYAYLFDVQSWRHWTDDEVFAEHVARSRWFTRAWTLQELIAPGEVIFFDDGWNRFYQKSVNAQQLSMITHIDEKILLGFNFRRRSIAERMSWASMRNSTRIEDQAYSLLGLFDVNIPLLYGEGSRAFRRLQEEIIRNSHDQSIFAWGMIESFDSGHESRLLAESPQNFATSGDIIAFSSRNQRPAVSFSLTNTGLNIRLPLWQTDSDSAFALLNCGPKDQPLSQFAIPLQQSERNGDGRRYVRVSQDPIPIQYFQQHMFEDRDIVIAPPYSKPQLEMDNGRKPKYYIRTMPESKEGYQLRDVHNPEAWNAKERIFSFENYRPSSDKLYHFMRFTTPKMNELVISFRNVSDLAYNGSTRKVAMYTLTDSNDIELAQVRHLVADLRTNIRATKVKQGYPGIYIHHDTHTILGRQMCVVDITTNPILFCQWFVMSRCLRWRIWTRMFGQERIHSALLFRTQDRLIMSLAGLFLIGSGLCVAILLWLSKR